MTTSSKKSKSSNITGDICLYGTGRTGAGFLVCRLDHGQVAGNGTVEAGRSFTEAVWMGVEELKRLGVTSGKVRIFEPTGTQMAVVDLNDVPYFGELKWEPAITYTIDAAQIIKAAQ